MPTRTPTFPSAWRFMSALVLPLALAACTQPTLLASPPNASSFGHVDVRFDLAQADAEADISAVTVGGISAFDLRIEEEAITVTVQGSPTSGPVPVTLTFADGTTVTFEEAFTYDKPVGDVGELWAVGASVAMGVQGGAIDQRGQLISPVAQVARQLGVFHPMPLLVPELFSLIEPEDIGAAPGCVVPDLDGHATTSAAGAIGIMNDVVNERTDFRLGRVDPDIRVQNLSVAGTSMPELHDGYNPDDFAQQFLAHLVLDIDGDLFDPVRSQQFELLAAGNPGMILLPDFIGNDLIDAVKASDVLDPELARGLDQVGDFLEGLVAQLAATGADVLIANMPLLSSTPLAMDVARGMVEDGTSESEVAALLDEIDERVMVLNTALKGEIDRYANVHLVDVAGDAAGFADGIDIGGQTVSTDKFRGLISTDGAHMSDTGYALMANAFLDVIERELGINAPRVDLVATLANDPYAPANLAARGLDVPGCTTTWGTAQ